MSAEIKEDIQVSGLKVSSIELGNIVLREE